MSEEQLKAFLEAVKANPMLQDQLKAAGDADAVVAISKAAGFVISADDVKRAQAEEISAGQLEGVVGGGGPQVTTPPAGCSTVDPQVPCSN